DIYITLMHGEFDKGKKKTPKNVEVTMSVHDEDGNLLEKAIHPGAGYKGISEYKSVVYYQVKQPCWYETVKVSIEIKEVSRYHLRFTFRHRSSQESRDKSERAFGMAFVKLMNADGTTLQDGRHNLVVYKGENKKMEDAKFYLTLPATKEEMDDWEVLPAKQPGVNFTLTKDSTKDSFQIATLICSTKLTQNVDLLGLLNWRSNSQNIRHNLKKLMEVEGGEIVKVFIISLIGDIKFQHFNPVLETYIYKHFSATLAYVKLTKVLNYYVGNADDSSKTELLFAALKALKYLFRFIVQSRVLYLGFYGKSEDGDEFNNAIRKLFLSFNILMDRPLEEAVKIKASTGLLFQSESIADSVSKCIVLFSKFIQSIPDNQLVRQKLNCMTKIVDSDLFRQAECRDVLLPLLVDQLSGQLDDNSSKPDHEACSQLLSNILEVLDQKDVGPTATHIQLIMERLLRRINRTVIGMSRQSPHLGSFVACMTAILRQMEDTHYNHYINTFKTRQDLIDFLMETFIMFKDLIGKNVYPSDWMVMNMMQCRIFLRAINQYASVLNRFFLDQASFELQLWNNYFHLAVAFLTHDSLQLETFSQAKRSKIVKNLDDMVYLLQNFYKEKKREDIYIRYLYKLRDLHTGSENYTEAAYTLLLHAELLQWSDKPCASHLLQRDSYCVYSQLELKEKLYQEIIAFLDKGKKAIQLSKELANMYENKVFDYEGLGNLLKKRATFYENIMKAMRPQPEYFAVGYFGQGFPSFLRNKIFIYRGKEYERREDFNLKLLTQFPNAEKLSSTAPPTDDIKASSKQYVQCFTVKPVMNFPPNFKDKPVPEQILNSSYIRPNIFHFLKIHQNKNHLVSLYISNGVFSFQTMRIERTTYVTAYSFPGILKWFEVKQVTVEEISPLENAIETMELTNEKISNCVQQHAWDRTLPVHPLSMLLNGIVDPAVMGGYTNYEKAFFTEKYIQEHPEDQDKIELLKQLIALQMPLLAEGIRIHGKKLTDQLKPLHDRLTSCFKELREKVEKQYGVITLPSSLTERKQSRSGSVVLPYIMSSTLRRLSVTSVTSSVVSTSSTSSDSTSSRPGSDGSVLEPLVERSSVSSRLEDSPAKDDTENRTNKFRRKDWSLSRSQVITSKEPEADFTPKTNASGKAPRPKSLQLGESRLSLLQNTSFQQATPLSPPPITPKTPRTQSFPSLQTDGLSTTTLQSTAPPPPPKCKPYENANSRNSGEVAPPLPTRREVKPPPPPPKARKSSVLSLDPGLQ
ncbi:hypothetical protein JRQ81_011072, partial [Phrynocephalus forsythii]